MVNIVVMKNKELRQEIVLLLEREIYKIGKKEELEDSLEGGEKSFLNESQISAISSKQLL